MVSPFGAAWRAAYPALQRAFGDPEGFTLQPMSRGGDVNGSATADPTRPAVDFDGIFDAEAASVPMEGRGRAGSWTEQTVATQPQIDVAASAFPNRPATGDIVLRLSTGLRYAIADVWPSDLGRLVLRLNLA